MSRAIPTLILLACLTFLLGLGRQAITDSDEAFYAEAAREMVESGDWLTPHFNYENRWEKPVLYYWLTAATYLVTGATEGAARFWSAFSGVGLVLLTWAIARRAQSGRLASWIAAAIVATCFGCFAEARLALPDLPLAFCITLTIWSALRAGDADRRAWWVLTGAGAGLGFLMKGPVALILPGLVLLPIWWRERRTLHVRASGIVCAALVFAAIGLPWYVAMWRVHGNEYIRFFFLENNVERFATQRYSGPRSMLFYVPIVIGGLLPWSAYLVAFAICGLSRVVRRRAVLSDTTWRLLLWAIVPLLFYSASVGKQPRYILPVIAPIAILLGRALATQIDGARRAQPSVALRSGTWITAALFSVLAAVLLLARPIFIDAFPIVSMAGIVALSVSAGAVAWIATVGAWNRLPGVLAAAAAALMLAIQFGALAGQRPEAVEQIAALVRAHRSAGERVGEYQVFVRNLVFYLGFKQEDLYDVTRAAAFVQSPERVLLVVRRSDVSTVQAAAGVSLTTLGSVRYLNAANLKVATVLMPDEGDVETVVLVANR